METILTDLELFIECMFPTNCHFSGDDTGEPEAVHSIADNYHFNGDGQMWSCSQSACFLPTTISVETIQANLKLFTESHRSTSSPSPHVLQRQHSSSSMSSVSSGVGENTVSAITNGQCLTVSCPSVHKSVCPSSCFSSQGMVSAPLQFFHWSTRLSVHLHVSLSRVWSVHHCVLSIGPHICLMSILRFFCPGYGHCLTMFCLLVSMSVCPS